MAREKLRAQLPKILLEMISVVFAVLFALAVDQWREEKAQADLAAEALEKVTLEVTTNRTNLAEMLPLQRTQIDKLRTGIEAGGSIRANFTAETLRNTAWQTAIMTEAVRFMEFETTSTLSDVYNLQNLVSKSIENGFLSLSSVDFHDDARREAAVKSLLGAYVQLVHLEEQLLEQYDVFLYGRQDRAGAEAVGR